MKKLTFEYVKNYIESFNYILLSTEYVNNKTKLKMECPNGHVFKMHWISFNNNNNRCPICFINNKKHTYEYIKNYIEKYNYQLLSKKYINNKIKLKIKCDKEHEYKVNFNVFKRGQRCPLCNGNFKHTYEHVKNYIEKYNYKLLSKKYINRCFKLEIQCSFGHIYKTTFGNFKTGYRCPICNLNKVTSKGEKQVLKYVKEIYNGIIISNDRKTILNPKTNHFLEMDVHLPLLNKAIEFNGDYWHSFPDRQLCDKIKKEQCKKLGINLLVIKEQNWNNNKIKERKNIKGFILGEPNV